MRANTQIRIWMAMPVLLAGTLTLGAQVPGTKAQVDRCAGPLGALVPGCQSATGGASLAMPRLPGMPPAMAGAAPGEAGVVSAVLPEHREAMPPLPPEPPSEFQQFVAVSIGKTLPVFGASLFERAPTTFAPVERAPVTADYVVGPGDQILLRVWGQATLNLDLTVDRGGQIYIPQVGSVAVAGLQFQQLRGFLKAQFGAGVPELRAERQHGATALHTGLCRG